MSEVAQGRGEARAGPNISSQPAPMRSRDPALVS
jgi:hypothetical protein